ncbi:hypothetical protein RHSIM_Rhsim04G0109700 [Rhododendron simsii]|uniref:Uncharacterized protein n=1 Tax=Rhododendron simsii TaxID=118357 RepID=A0A834LQY7_RHOSS|nr:hypothetical protein RHSIM_Rhsim04G0109700 [Rhododendron simsii]
MLKIPMVREYVAKREVNIDELYEEVVNVVSDARKCYYAEGLIEKFNDEEFTHMMMVLDGCFILHNAANVVIQHCHCHPDPE